ncbi:exported hypothetical protein [Vibrio chagasii]|nr:exported hypothetical protein [Vibrio chagasii]
MRFKLVGLIALAAATVPAFAEYQPTSFAAFGTMKSGDFSEYENALVASGGSLDAYGRYGLQLSSMGASYAEKWLGQAGNSYVENTYAYKFGVNRRLNKYIYNYAEIGMGGTTRDGIRGEGKHKYFVSEIGVILRPFKHINLMAGYNFAATPDEMKSVNGFSLKAGIVF